MRIDRSRFLMLTTAIASGACHSEQAPQAPVRVAAPARATPSMVPQDGAERSRADGAGSDAPRDVHQGLGAPDPDAEGDGESVRLDGTNEPTHQPSDLVTACQRLRPPPAPHCEGFHWTQTLCEAFDRSLEPPVARAAVACLKRHSGRAAICNPDTREDCFAKAITAIAAGRQDRGRCASLVSQCSRGGYSAPGLSKTSCRRAVAAVRPAFRDEMLTCIAESCTIRECVYSVEP
ncbi:MAG: hypothetical protein JRI23_32320 [Deltaproteobacteria bacterium]|jgi:hypothetical protein|nr:hypothetical protein [Deltaproteobacteria bacterium]MBW2536930.1 hypothetical protein [Deltaproteobacteria bacterium]